MRRRISSVSENTAQLGMTAMGVVKQERVSREPNMLVPQPETWWCLAGILGKLPGTTDG